MFGVGVRVHGSVILGWDIREIALRHLNCQSDSTILASKGIRKGVVTTFC